MFGADSPADKEKKKAMRRMKKKKNLDKCL